MSTHQPDPDPSDTAQQLLHMTHWAHDLAVKAQSAAAARAVGADRSLFDPQSNGAAYLRWMVELSRNPGDVLLRSQQAWLGAAQAWTDAWTGRSPETRDKRFRDGDWDADPVSRGLRDSYLAVEGATLGLLGTLPKAPRTICARNSMPAKRSRHCRPQISSD